MWRANAAARHHLHLVKARDLAPGELLLQAALHGLSRFPLFSALVIIAACRIDRDAARTHLVAESVITIHRVIRHVRLAVSGGEQRRCCA
jgi:hypothetical protein